MKNIYVFSYEIYHPHGGFHDFVGRFENLEAVINFLKTEYNNKNSLIKHSHILDIVEITEKDIRTLVYGKHILEILGYGHDEPNDEIENFKKIYEKRLKKVIK